MTVTKAFIMLYLLGTASSITAMEASKALDFASREEEHQYVQKLREVFDRDDVNKLDALLTEKPALASCVFNKNTGVTALHLAVELENKPMLQVLLKHKAKTEVATHPYLAGGSSPLTEAVMAGNKEIVLMLLAANADPNFRHYGDTALGSAVMADNRDIAITLMKHGAYVILKHPDNEMKAATDPLNTTAMRPDFFPLLLSYVPIAEVSQDAYNASKARIQAFLICVKRIQNKAVEKIDPSLPTPPALPKDPLSHIITAMSEDIECVLIYLMQKHCTPGKHPYYLPALLALSKKIYYQYGSPVLEVIAKEIEKDQAECAKQVNTLTNQQLAVPDEGDVLTIKEQKLLKYQKRRFEDMKRWVHEWHCGLAEMKALLENPEKEALVVNKITDCLGERLLTVQDGDASEVGTVQLLSRRLATHGQELYQSLMARLQGYW